MWSYLRTFNSLDCLNPVQIDLKMNPYEVSHSQAPAFNESNKFDSSRFKDGLMLSIFSIDTFTNNILENVYHGDSLSTSVATSP